MHYKSRMRSHKNYYNFGVDAGNLKSCGIMFKSKEKLKGLTTTVNLSGNGALSYYVRSKKFGKCKNRIKFFARGEQEDIWGLNHSFEIGF